jgi:hypothetical protein
MPNNCGIEKGVRAAKRGSFDMERYSASTKKGDFGQTQQALND